MKVRIKSLGLPKAAYGQQANYGLSLNGSGNAGSMQSNEFAMKSGLKPKRTIGGVPREEANLEAEGGETVVGQISGDGIVDHMTIKGPRHSSGGVPMNLPDDSFIFSDTKSMKIKDPKILQMFGKSKGSYTPAELAKPYDISKYKAILMDSDTDRLSRNTAEIMIKNIVMKLGALALAQEAKKGFPQGIPEIAKPYMEANGISEEDLIPELKAQAEQMQAMQQQQAMQMQQAQGMQQPQMQQQGPPQGMPPMMPDGQPVAMPQQGMAPPQQPMMDPRQMMAMQQEQQMMPPQPQQGMPMAAYGIIAGVGGTPNDPCPSNFYWNEHTGECEPMSENLPTIKEINNNPVLKGFLEDLEYKRNIQNYQNNYREKKWREFLDENYDGPNDRNSNEYQKFINSADYLKFMETVPHQYEEDFELPRGYKIKTFYDKKGDWKKDEKSKELFNDLFKPAEEWEQEQLEKNKTIKFKGDQEFKGNGSGSGTLPTNLQELRKDEWCPCYKQKERILASGESVIEKVCVPCESQPMAAYGMQLGGYDMPFIMGTGGMMRYDHGGPHNETVDGREAKKVEILPEEGTSTVTDQSGYEAKTIEERIAAEKKREEAREAVPGGSTPSSGWEDSICNMIKNGATWEELTDPAKAPGGKTHLNPNSAAAKAIWDRCKGDQSVFEETVIEKDVYVVPVEDVTEGTCGCPDPEGGTNEDGTPKLINVQTKAALGIPEDKPCDDDYCEETTTITDERKLDNEIEPLPLIPATSFRRGVADPIKPGLDIIGAGERNYLDYKTAVQNDQGALEKQIAAIKTMPGVSVGQKQAMIAQVQGQSKAPLLVTDVYNKNNVNANQLAKSDEAMAMRQQQLQAGIDGQYNQDLANTENQYTQNVNAARQYKVENAKDNMRTQMMMKSIGNSSENFDALANFTGGTDLQKQLYAACIAAGGTVAKCMAQILGTEPVESETPAPASVNEPPPTAPAARYGRIVNPYIMASSVYPWSK